MRRDRLWSVLVVAMLVCPSGCGRPAREQAPAADKGTRGARALGRQGASGPRKAPGRAESGGPRASRDLGPRAVGYDFLLNRVASYRYAGSVLQVRCAGPSFAKFVDGAWKNPWALRVPVPAAAGAAKGQVGASPAGLAGNLLLPVVEPGKPHDLVVEFATWLPGQAVTLMVNGKTLRSRPVPTGVSAWRFSIPADRLVAGDNVFRFIFRKSAPAPGGATVSGVVTGLGGRLARTPKVPGVFLRLAFGPGAKLPEGGFAVRFQGTGPRKEAVLQPGGRLVHYVLVPKGGALSLEAACQEARCGLELTAETDESRLSLGTKGLSSAPGSVTADLSKLAGRAARISIRAQGGPVRIRRFDLLTAKREPISWQAKPIRYVFLWIADTLREDMVYALAGGEIKTQNYDAFVKKAISFPNATSPGNHSMTSHASYVTGQVPPVHGFENAKRRVRPDSPALYEIFHRAGWLAGLFSSNGYVSDRWGFKRGLDVYRNFIREKKANATEYLWGAARKYLRKVLETRKDKKVFLYLATIDPHVTYDPPTKYLKLYFPKPYKGPVPRRVTGFYLEKIIKGIVKVESPEDRRYLKALYMGEVTYNDEWFGHFLKDLEKFGILDESVVLVTSDHGDQFWEHGSVGHGDHLYQEEIAVPVMLWWPGLKGGKILDWTVEAGDLMPTLLDLAGLPVPGQVQYASWLPLLKQDHEPAMLSAFAFNAGRSRSVRMGRYKLIARVATRPKLFDLDRDPTEQHDLAAKAPVALRLLRTVFSLGNAYLPEWRKAVFGPASNLTAGFWTKGPGRHES